MILFLLQIIYVDNLIRKIVIIFVVVYEIWHFWKMALFGQSKETKCALTRRLTLRL